MNTSYKPLKENSSYFFPDIDKNTASYIRWEDLSRTEKIINVAAIFFLIWLFIKFIL